MLEVKVVVRILVVEDNQQKLTKLVKVLEEAGVDREAINIAQTGMDARRLLGAQRYDLLILDIALPMRPEDSPDRTGGMKLLEELVERGTYQLPYSVVGLTGFVELRNEFEDQFRARLWALEHYDSSDYSWVDRLQAKVKYIVSRVSQRDRIHFANDVCVIAALNTPELTAVKSMDWGWSAANSLDEVGYYYEGRFTSGGKSRTVVAAAAPRMGMVATAILTMKMILTFRPRLLAMVGVCAGLKGICEIGDILVGDPVWDWQMGKHSNGTFYVAPDHIDIPTAVAERFVQLGADKQLWFEAWNSYAGHKPRNIPLIKVGPVTSGSAVLADQRILTEIKLQHRKLLGVEMELYGMYAAARDCSLPTPITFGIKSVCDYADDMKGDEFQAYAAAMSVRGLVAFCERYGADFVDA
jgi:nucleoside phosphorylase